MRGTGRKGGIGRVLLLSLEGYKSRSKLRGKVEKGGYTSRAKHLIGTDRRNNISSILSRSNT